MAQMLEWLADEAGRMVDKAGRVAETLVNEGRNTAEKVALQARLAKLQRQLGALVYSQRKAGEQNEAMVEWYISEMDGVKTQLAQHNHPKPKVTVVGKSAAEATEDAMFCGGSGN